jgi:hypothetical protein
MELQHDQREYAVLTFLILAILSTGASAYQCLPAAASVKPADTMRSLVESELAESRVLFEGEVERFDIKHTPGTPVPKGTLGMRAWDGEAVVVIHASRIYRGPNQGTFEVDAGMNLVDSDSNEFLFEVGKSYLVDASQGSQGRLGVSSCGATRLLERAGPELRFLRGEPPTADDLLSPKEYHKKWPLPAWGKICGRVSQKNGSPPKEAYVTAWLLRGPLFPEKLADESAKADGSFCLDSLPSGHFLIGAEDRNESPEDSRINDSNYVGYDPGVAHVSKSIPIALKDGQAISNAKIVLYPEHLYSLRGKVVTSDNSPLPSKYVTVGIESADGEVVHPSISAEEKKVREDGSFEFTSLPPGAYSVFAFFDSGIAPLSAKIWRTTEVDVTINGETNGVVLKVEPQD